MKIAVYPGTFDPLTLGHLDVLKKAAKIFDKVVVGILINLKKTPLFSQELRQQMIEECLIAEGLHNVHVRFFDGMTVDFCEDEEAIAIVRGMRMTTEYEGELTISINNDILSEEEIITVLFPPAQRYIHISSSVVRELMRFNKLNQLHRYVPKIIEKYIQERLLE